MSKEIKRYYKIYSNTEHNYSNILTDQQYMFVDYCVGFIIDGVTESLYNSGKFPLWDKQLISDAVNEALGGTYVFFWGVAENYEEWYNKNKNIVIENIWEALDEVCNDYTDLICDAYAEYLRDEIKSLKAELVKLKKEEKRFNAEVA